MTNYFSITRVKIYKTMKLLLFFMPIGLITNKIYIYHYGEYIFKLDKQHIADNFSFEQTIFTIISFIVLSLIIWIIEKFILPEIVIMGKEFQALKKNLIDLDEYYNKKYGYNVFKKIKEQYPDSPIKIMLIEEIIFWSVVFSLWVISFNTILGCLLSLFIFVLTIIGCKYAIALLNGYEIKKKKTN